MLGGDVLLSLSVAVPVGLIRNELVSNALVHAFPSDRSGEVSVVLERTADRCRLRVRDDGVGLPEDFEVRVEASLGTMLVRELVAQLGGTSSMTSDPDGTSLEVSFPADVAV